MKLYNVLIKDKAGNYKAQFHIIETNDEWARVRGIAICGLLEGGASLTITTPEPHNEVVYSQTKELFPNPYAHLAEALPY